MDVTSDKNENEKRATADLATGDARVEGLETQLKWSLRQITELSAQLAQYQHHLREERNECSRVVKELAHLVARLTSAEKLVRSMEVGMDGMRRSFSMQLGHLLSRAFRSPWEFVRLPIRLMQLLRASWSRDEALPAVPIPEAWYPVHLRLDLAHFYAQVGEPAGDGIPRGSRLGQSRTGRRIEGLPGALADIRVAAVMDQFTLSAFRECCSLTELTPEEWRDEIDACDPHLLFLESAWDGKDGRWQRKVSQVSDELRALTGYCRENGIPVVFWSKEDPVHFKTFIRTAELADVVFTTDIDCIGHYKSELGHERVFLLPFATQARTHNPIEAYRRKPWFCFAGSYYRRYPVRQRDFRALIDGASKLGEVAIYDRNHGKDHPNYTFPEEYGKFILGRLPFDQIDLAYKGYDFGININTVKNSQSMFARRVFDLLASNTTVVSNYSRGLSLMFGDLVVCSDDAGRIESSLRPLIDDPVRRRKHRLAGLRKVTKEHTYQHRLAYVWQKVYGISLHSAGPEMVVVASAASERELARLLAAFHRQTWSEKSLVLFFRDGFRPAHSPVALGIRVLSELQASAWSVAELAVDGCVATFHPDDYYGPEYLTDLALAFAYSVVPEVGKMTRYVQEHGAAVLHEDGSQYRLGAPVRRRCGAARCSSVGPVSVADWVARLNEPMSGPSLALDEFNYCEGGGDGTCAVVVNDLPGLDKGMPLSRILATAEAIGAAPVADDREAERDESAGLPGLESAELHARFGAPLNKHLAMRLAGGELIVDSTLPAGKHAYAYLDGDFKPTQLNFTDIGKFQLVAGKADGLNLVLVYKDGAGQKISHSILGAGVNVTVTLPEGTQAVALGVKVGAAGEFRIRRLVCAHVPLAVEAMVTRGRHLLLAKNYPSYDDLYKHAFVHRRVLEYRKRGVEVDVFRIGNYGLSFYEFDGVDVAYGQADHLRSMLMSGRYDSVLVHFLDERMAAVLNDFVDRCMVYVWAHGAEIQSASRRQFDHLDDSTRTRAIALGERRMRFWRRVFLEAHPNLHMVFVSRWFADDVMQDVGVSLPGSAYRVIHNFIDTDFFAYVPKATAQRRRILSIRPFESAKYANDLSVAAVLALREKPFFSELEFRFIGDGRFFEETVAPLQGLSNVVIERRFLKQSEIAALHRDYGVFLSPTRMDAQGVSRDEAMSSGLVPISTRCTAIPEFVDEDSGLLVEPEDAKGLAEAIEHLYHHPELFARLSRGAAERVRLQSGYAATIAREIEMFDGASRPARVDEERA